MKIDPVSAGFAFFDQWRERELGKKLVRWIAPEFAARREAKRAQRTARRAARQRQPDEAAGEFFQREEDKTMEVVPKNTMRKGGVALVGLSPVIGAVVGVGLKLAGVGEECTPEAIEAGCQTAEQIATTITGLVAGVVSAVGGVMYWLGRNRAEKRGE